MNEPEDESMHEISQGEAAGSASSESSGLLKTDLLSLLRGLVFTNPAEWMVPDDDGDEDERCFFCGKDEGQNGTEFIHDDNCAGLRALKVIQDSSAGRGDNNDATSTVPSPPSTESVATLQQTLETQHSLLPWAVSNERSLDDSVTYWQIDSDAGSVAEMTTPADEGEFTAKFIVECVNSHADLLAQRDALVEALKTVDREASVAHDAIWAQEAGSAGILHDNDRPDSAQSAIWRLHTAARTALSQVKGE